jgi:hypothetical protein
VGAVGGPDALHLQHASKLFSTWEHLQLNHFHDDKFTTQHTTQAELLDYGDMEYLKTPDSSPGSDPLGPPEPEAFIVPAAGPEPEPTIIPQPESESEPESDPVDPAEPLKNVVICCTSIPPERRVSLGRSYFEL